MSSFNSARDNPERSRVNARTNQIQKTNFIEIEKNKIKHEEHVDNIKIEKNIRIMQLNAKRLDSWNERKMAMFISLMKKYDADVMLIAEPNIKWAPRNEDKIVQSLKALGRETITCAADSKM